MAFKKTFGRGMGGRDELHPDFFFFFKLCKPPIYSAINEPFPINKRLIHNTTDEKRAYHYHYAIPPTSPTCSADAMLLSPAAILRVVAERLWVEMAMLVEFVVSTEILVLGLAVMVTGGAAGMLGVMQTLS